MSQYSGYKPDGRVFASYPMPAKIDLINERPRRESQVEQQLANQIGTPTVPRIEVTEQRFSPVNYANQHQLNFSQQQSTTEKPPPDQTNNFNQQQMVKNHQVNPLNHHQNDQLQSVNSTSTTFTTAAMRANNSSILAAELAEKEAKLMADIQALHSRPYSPFKVPDKIDLSGEQRKTLQQYENAPSSRPGSRTSSSRSNSANFFDKEAKLLQEIEEMERKPFNPQTMVVEREEWFEYPEGKPYDRHLTDSKRRVKDFCSLPSNMYSQRGAHYHEDNLIRNQASATPSSIHTTIIRSPKRKIDNKSPLPFAFDNFSTKGVRGNIASAGAIEPERPRPPIYPIMKRTPSPNMAR